MSKKKDIIKTDIQTSDGIAIDWIHDLLYWTETGFNSIQVASLDGVQKATIISDDLDEPRGITLDPKNGCVDVFFLYAAVLLLSKADLQEGWVQTMLIHTRRYFKLFLCFFLWVNSVQTILIKM